MFEINEDKTINITRGDIGAFTVDVLNEAGENYIFQKGDVVRIKVTEKKACENVMFQKDFVVEEETEQVEILLTEEDTKIGEVISKPTDYWYEIELNPFTNPQTIIGYDEDGAKIFKLFPEGKDIEPIEPTPEDIPVVDEELDLTSERPVQNHVIARAILNLQEEITKIDTDVNITSEDLEPLVVGIEENKSNIAKNKGNIEDLTSNVENLSNTLDTHTADKNNPHNVTAEQVSIDNSTSGLSANNVQGAIDKLSEHVGLYKKNYLNNKATTSTINGVTFTVNNDKSVTVNGTATSDAVLLFDPDAVKYDGDFILSGNSVNGSNSTFCMFVANYDSNGNKTDEFLGNNKEIQLNSNSVSYRLGIIVYSGVTVNNITFYPMVRYASIEDDTYEPYVADVLTRLTNIKEYTVNLNSTYITNVVQNKIVKKNGWAYGYFQFKITSSVAKDNGYDIATLPQELMPIIETVVDMKDTGTSPDASIYGLLAINQQNGVISFTPRGTISTMRWYLCTFAYPLLND